MIRQEGISSHISYRVCSTNATFSQEAPLVLPRSEGRIERRKLKLNGGETFRIFEVSTLGPVLPRKSKTAVLLLLAVSKPGLKK